MNCDDNSNTDEFPADLHASTIVEGLLPGDSIFIRVLGKFGNNAGDFAIIAWNDELHTAIAAEPNCDDQITITASVSAGNNYWWNSYYDQTGSLLANVNPRGQENDFSIRVGTLSSPALLDRFLVLTSSEPADSVDIQFYFTEAEWVSLQSRAAGLSHPLQLKIFAASPDCVAPNSFSAVGFQPTAYRSYSYSDTMGQLRQGHVLIFRSMPGYAFYFGSAEEVPLPVKWGKIDLHCEEGYPVLQWETLTEINTREFNIERSADGIFFQAIGSVPAAAHSVERRVYYFKDENKNAKAMYYRLRQVDEDGKQSFSRMLRSFCELNRSVQLYPNPADKVTRINWPQDLPVSSLQVVDQSGRLIQQRASIQAHPWLDLEVSNLARGVYQVLLVSRDARIIGRQSLIKY